MNVFNFIELNGFTVKLLIVTVIVAVAELLLKKFGKKLPAFVVKYLPLILAFIAEFVAVMISKDGTIIPEEVLCGGLMAYSIGTLAAVWVRKLFRGEVSKDELFLLIKSVAGNLCGDDSAAVNAIVKLLRNFSAGAGDHDILRKSIALLLKKAARQGVSDAEITAAAEEILLSANRIKEK